MRRRLGALLATVTMVVAGVLVTTAQPAAAVTRCNIGGVIGSRSMSAVCWGTLNDGYTLVVWCEIAPGNPYNDDYRGNGAHTPYWPGWGGVSTATCPPNFRITSAWIDD